jgi:two-component system, NtrC family, sensor histidine kinase GlrK
MRKSFRPTSVVQLVLIAIALVAIPLTIALLSATVALEHFAARSQHSVLRSVHVIDAGRTLVEEVTAMERHARQYLLLGEWEFFDAYLRRRDNFQLSLAALRHGEFTAEFTRALDALDEAERRVFGALSVLPPTADQARDAIASFPELGDRARQILAASSLAIGQEVEEMRLESVSAQRNLTRLALAVIPAALLLAFVGTLLITRPIRKLDRAIRRLGRGDFDAPVRVRGPADLEELGERLEWLRLRLLDIDAQKVRFLRHVSHELKTPLAAVREGAQLLSDQVVGNLTPAQAEVASILCSSSLELQKRIEDLLHFNTILEGLSAPIAREPVDLGPLLNTVLESRAEAIQDKRLGVELEVSALQYMGDREQLRVVLDNLMSNAIKYSPTGGRIRIAMLQRDDDALIEFENEGPEIDPDERDKIFEAFYQGSAVHEGHVGGTGLGLAITQEYVRNHQGTIEVAEASRGACMRVVLPIVEAGATEVGEAEVTEAHT